MTEPQIVSLTAPERAEIWKQLQLMEAVFLDMADASMEESQRLGAIAWEMRGKPTNLPADAPESLRALNMHLARRAARRAHQRGHLPVVKLAPRARAREHRPSQPRRSGASSASSGADPGDPDPEPEPEPPDADRLRELLQPYNQRCPLCIAPIRALGDPAIYVGCAHCSWLLELATAAGGAS